MKSLVKHVIMTGYRPKSDGSITYSFTTSTEQTSEDVKEAHELRNCEGVILFKAKLEDITEEEIDKATSVDNEIETKSQAKRIRNTLYVLFTKDNKGYADFKDFYKFMTEHYINNLKSKIQEYDI